MPARLQHLLSDEREDELSDGVAQLILTLTPDEARSAEETDGLYRKRKDHGPTTTNALVGDQRERWLKTATIL